MTFFKNFTRTLPSSSLILGTLDDSSKAPNFYNVIEKFAVPNQKLPNYGEIFSNQEFHHEIFNKYKLVFFGEKHSIPEIIEFQNLVQMAMSESLINYDSATLHVVMEHFSFEMQGILDKYQSNNLSFEELLEEYDKIGTEGHDLKPYFNLLQFAKQNYPKIILHGGFIPRTFGRLVMKEGEEMAIKIAKDKDYLPSTLVELTGSEFHYNLFESMITGRYFYDLTKKPTDNWRKLFKAQLIKDEAMAYKVCKLLKDENENGQDKYLIIAGDGHIKHFTAVTERVLKHSGEIIDDLARKSMIINCFAADSTLNSELTEREIRQGLELNFGPAGANPGDYLYVYKNNSPEEPITEYQH